MKMKIFSLVFAVLLAMTLFFGCASSTPDLQQETQTASQDASQSSDGGNTWSVFVYMCGTDLESGQGSATQNLQEMMSVALPENINVIIQTGGTAAWQTEGIPSDVLGRYELVDNGLMLADEQPLASMGDAATLGEFLKWGVESYPADKYMSVLWNHGGGSVSGVAFDELFEGDSLTLPELSQAFAMSGAQFEIIGFDTCLMATLENAAAVAPYGNYLVASQELEPGGGWDYSSWLQYMSDNPGLSGLEIGTKICDGFYDKCASTGDEALATLSVTDLSQIGNVISAFDAMATEMSGVASDINTLQPLTQAFFRAQNYGGNNENEGYTNMVDVGDIANNAQDVLTETSTVMIDALAQAVPYQIMGSSRTSASGLSVFYPLTSTVEEMDQYAQCFVSGQYLEFLAGMAGWTIPEGVVTDAQAVDMVSADEYNLTFETEITEDGVYNLQVTSGLETIESIQFGLYYVDAESNQFYVMGYDNDINADWDTGLFSDNFRGVWPTINGNYCSMTLVAEEDTANIYTIPILLNGEPTNLRVQYVFNEDETGYYEIIGTWDGIDSQTGMSARDLYKLQAGDEVTLLFNAVDLETDEENVFEMSSFVYDGNAVMEESELFNGSFVFQYEITDVFGQLFESDAIIIEYTDGEIFLSE